MQKIEPWIDKSKANYYNSLKNFGKKTTAWKIFTETENTTPFNNSAQGKHEQITYFSQNIYISIIKN